MRTAVLPMLPIVALLACGGSTPEPRHADADRGADRDRARGGPSARDRSPASRSDRDLAPGATFGDLASAARRQDDRRDQDADAGCLVRRAGDRWRLEADLAVAVRPLPEPPEDLDARLEAEPGPLRILTRFGTYGAGDTALVAINTTLPPSRGVALSIVLTDRGLYVRRSDAAGGERSPSRLDWVIEHAPFAEVDLVAITAEARVPVDALAELLARIPESLAGRVTLAVALAPGTRLPESSAVAPGERADPCPDGLPGLPDDAPLGDLGADAIRGALDPLRRGAELCVGTSSGAGAAGGRVALAVRIGPDGRVEGACVTEDATGDGELRACLVRAARELTFDAPGGYLDFVLPLALEPGRAQRQLPLCR